MGNECEVCGSMPAGQQPPLNGLPSHGRDCPRCGTYWLVGTAIEMLRRRKATGEISGSVLSHRLRHRFDSGQKPVVLYESDLAQYVGDTKLPKPQEQANNLILWIGDSQQSQDDWVQATPSKLAAIVGVPKVADRSDEPGFDWLFNEIKGSGLFIAKDASNGSQKGFRLTMAGWKEFDALRRRAVDSRTAFMAMKFGDATLNRVLADCFKPAVTRAGFQLRLLTDGQGAGLIDDHIRVAIRTARFVVADLSHNNDGAYFEAGFAEGLGIPVIYTCEAKKFAKDKTHFDTNHRATIIWSIEELEKAGAELTAKIRNTLPGEAKMSDE